MKNGKLIIVESPTKSKTLSGFLGNDFVIEATMGHIRDLPPNKIGVDTKADFLPTYILVDGKEEVVSRLKKAAKSAKIIYLATDPDREGEAIAWHTAQILDGKKLSFKRIVFHEITKTAIEKALTAPREIDMHLVDAQQGRRILDRLVGYKLSPLLWFKIRRGLSAGRVQSVAVKFICDREKEIEKFIPEEYWEIWTDLKKQVGESVEAASVFSAKLVKKNGETFKVENGKVAQEATGELKEAGFEVEEIEKKEVKRFPGPPFRTATLQQAASSRFGWPARRTMRVAQGLYEKGLITYHRTDSTYLSSEAISKAREYIQKQFGSEYVPAQPKLYKKASKVAQEAHEAIRPTGGQWNLGSGESAVKEGEKDGARLYDLILKRFLASQTKEAVFDQTKILVLATGRTNHFLLEAQGRTIIFPGWLVFFEKEKANAVDEVTLPKLVKGDDLVLVKIDPQQKFTQPPFRYTEATLIKVLEEFGIGRPSTYAPIISTIQDRQYVEKIEPENGGQKKFFKPTPLGSTVNEFLTEYFPDIVETSFTAAMEDDLDEIANGKKEWVKIISEFYKPFSEKLKSVSKVAQRMVVPTEATGEDCPSCGAPLVIRIGTFGKFVSCSKFPECRFTKPFLEMAGFNCEKCGSPMVVKKSKKGKTFFGCSKYPKCKFATWRKPFVKKDETKT